MPGSAFRTFLILTAGACGMAVLLALLPATGHDQMWLLYAARLVLHGAQLYGPQVFEANPPLIIWLSMIPESFAHLLHLPDTAIGKLFVVSIELGIGALCLRLLRRLRGPLSRTELAALTFVFVTVFAVMPARDFGQRDHLLILLLLPYIVAAAIRAEGKKIPPLLGWLIGTLVLLGCALKPYQLLVPIFVEAAIFFINREKTRRAAARQLVRPELLAILVAGVLFLLCVHRFAPLYLASVVPLVRDTYWAYGGLTFSALVGASIQLHLLALLDIALIFAAGWRSTSAMIRLLMAAGFAATLAFYLQGTGWYYQQLPALSLFTFALAFLLLDRATRIGLNLPRWSPAAAAGLTLLALALTTHFMNYPFTAERSFPLSRPDPAFFAGLPEGAAVMTISPAVDDTIMPIFKYHLILGERYSSFVLLPALLRAEDPQGRSIPRHFSPDHLAALDRIQHAYMVEDLNRWHPVLILVERCQDAAVHCQVLEDRHDDLLAYFKRDPAFAAIFAHYRYLRSVGDYDAYVAST